MKRISEIFSDYEAKGNLNSAIVQAVVLTKRTKTLEMKISSDKYIETREIESLNQFIRKRLAINDSIITVVYAEGTHRKPLEEELENILSLMSDKHPVLSGALKNCDYEIVQNHSIKFTFKTAVSYLLKARGYDKKIQETVKNLYDATYQINFVDNVSSEELKRLQEATQETEILLLQKEVAATPSHYASELPKEAAPIKPENNGVKDGKKGDPSLILGRNATIKDTVIKITDITPDEGRIAIQGELSNIEAKELRSGKTLISFDLFDGSSSMTCKAFIKPGEDGEILSRLKKAKGVKLAGNVGLSQFSEEIELIANTIVEAAGMKKAQRQDRAEEKRVELHMHTQMSQMDAMTSATDLIKRAMSWGMKSIAITDHGVVQSFPEAHKLLGRDNPNMKVIYGVEAYLTPDKKSSVTNAKGQSMDTTYCVLDLETTGFSAVTEKITEIGIMKLKDGKVIDQFSCFVNPKRPIPARVVEVTNITDDMVKDAETIEKVFPKLLEFIEGSVLVAHNAEFDLGFLKHNAKVLGYDFDYTYLDTLSLAKKLFPDYKTYKLGRIAKNLGFKVEVAHRALDDVDTTVKVFNVMLEKLKQRGAETLEDIDLYGSDEDAKKAEYKKLKTYHAIILAKDYVGLKNLYKLVSYSHLDYFYKKPRILKSLYKKYSEGLIMGSACSEGELYQAILLGKSKEEIEAIAMDFDYLEIQPMGNNDYLVRTEQVPDKDYLKEINRKIVALIAQKLVWKSNEDGYLVGSRGSVGSSVVAYMTGITEVNALQAHYRCPSCQYSDFSNYGVKIGFDLPDKVCPVCGEKLAKDGIDIPFETFLGFNGDKEPDIDLNFSGEYQAKAHKYTEVIFGKGTTFKAGTIGTIAEKTAFGYVKKYYEEKSRTVSKAETLRVSKGCTGIKRTSGQHPGGIIVVPKGREIFEFCPVQHPADDSNSDIITTHFDYHSIYENLLKLDILGHDDPTVIRMLQDITGVDPLKIPMDDQETMSIFSSTEALEVTPEQINSKVGTFGIPEFGTKFVRGMLLDTRPKAFADLICISGLSHGTDVWVGNAKDLIDAGTVTLSEAVCTRDDIMTYLIKKGLPPNTAFKIMELVRKGKALSNPEKWAEYEALMREHKVPEWYIDSCRKIKYMFPKAHAAAYVMMAFRIAWFKVHIPQAYYAAYFTIRAKAFDAEFMIYGKEKVKAKMKEIEALGNIATPKDKEMYDDLELVLEMYERGFKFLPIDLYKSQATKFLVEEEGLRPPINSISGLGTVATEGLYNAAQEKPFNSIEDVKKRAKIGNSTIDSLRKFSCFKGIPESDQMSLFDVI